MQHVRPVGILGVGAVTPDRILTNADLEQMVDTSDEWITSRTGIKERRIAAPDTATSDLALAAAHKALSAARVEPDELDLIVVATVTPDMLFPATACLVQDQLGASRAGAYDLSAGCSGFVYALDQAAHGIAAGAYEKVLVIGADILTRITDFTDRNTCVLFGDGAGAVVMGEVEAGFGLLGSLLGSDGGGGRKLCVPAGGSRQPLTPEALAAGEQFIVMSGNDVYKFAVRIMADACVQTLAAAGLTPDDLDLFIPHQANTRIIDAAARRLNLPVDKVFVNVQKYGNTSAASVPLALDEALAAGRIKDGDCVALVGFGAGLTWAGAVLRWGGVA